MRPKRILFIRHGEAEGNVDERLFETRPDHTMRLTERGIEQAQSAGQVIRSIVGASVIRVYVSPYQRARETLKHLEISDLVDRTREEPSVREQDWGNLQDGALIRDQKAARDHFGHFFYRLQHGESGADVYDRVSTFIGTLYRDFGRDDFPDNALIVTHGLTMRLLMMRWFRWSVDYFESLENPKFCEIKVLTDGPRGYELDKPFLQWKEADEF